MQGTSLCSLPLSELPSSVLHDMSPACCSTYKQGLHLPYSSTWPHSQATCCSSFVAHVPPGGDSSALPGPHQYNQDELSHISDTISRYDPECARSYQRKEVQTRLISFSVPTKKGCSGPKAASCGLDPNSFCSPLQGPPLTSGSLSCHESTNVGAPAASLQAAAPNCSPATAWHCYLLPLASPVLPCRHL